MRARPDRTRPDKVRGLSGWARLVEFSYKSLRSSSLNVSRVASERERALLST